MKVCIEAHVSPLFGEIPLGSLWEDDSPYLLEDFAHCFADVANADEPEPTPVPKVRKFKPKGDV